MAVANYGVNVTIKAEAARPIKVESLTPIGIVGDLENFEDLQDLEKSESGLIFYTNVTKALEGLDDKKGSVVRALKAINDQVVETPIILSVFKKDDEEAEDGGGNIAKCKEAVEKLKYAKSKFGYAPNLIIAPEYSHEDAIKGAIETMATRLKATGIVDLKASKVDEAVTKMRSFGTKRLIAAFPNVKIYDEETENYTFAPQSARIAGMISATDGFWEYGFSDSYSNRVMKGIFGTEIPIDFELGEGSCDADMLRTAKISTIINHEGYRTWGGETSDQDTIWQDLARVRVFDRISEACQRGVLFAIDKRANELYHAKRSVEELLRAFVGSNVLLGFDLSWSKKNTKANITAGKFYLDIRMQNNPIVKQLTLDFIYVDKYGDKLIETLKK